MSNNDLHILHKYDLEIGVTDALQRHSTRHVVPPKPVSQRNASLGAQTASHGSVLDYLTRDILTINSLRECIAGAAGVFFYVFPGTDSQHYWRATGMYGREEED